MSLGNNFSFMREGNSTWNLFVIMLLLLSLLFLPSFVFAEYNVSTEISAEKNNSAINFAAENKVIVYFFWGDGCPHCEHEKDFFDSIQSKYPELEIKSFETWYNQENANLFVKMAEAYGARATGVPATFLGEKVWIGYSDRTGIEIENAINECINSPCINPINKVGGGNGVEIHESDEFSTTKEVCVHAFVDSDCGECNETKEFISSLNLNNTQIVYHNVNDGNEFELYKKFKDIYGLTTAGYPIIFLGDNYLIGLNSIKNNFENIVNDCQLKDCPCPAEKINGLTPSMPKQDFKPEKTEIIEIPFVGEINIGELPLFFMTFLIAFIDGFNPCSLWMLTFLLGIVIYSGSRKKIFLVGITFLLVSATGYGAFILGLLNVFTYVGYTPLIKMGVALIATIFAIVNIKDYFWYKKGISFTISDKYKPKIFKDVRNVMDPNKSIASMLFATVLLTLGIVLVELPCTAGFPMVWTNILAQNQVTGILFLSLFALYILVYLSIELVVFGIVLVTLKASKFEEKQGRTLKLIGGMIMLALAIAMLFFYDLMNSIMGSIYIFGLAIVVSYVIIVLHTKVLPKFGIKIGTEHKELQDNRNKKEGEKNE